MHTRYQLKDTQFAIRIDGRTADPEALFPGWHRHDRFGLVIHDALGGVGASHLLQLAIWSYYHADDRRRGALDVYPEIYAFHIGGGHGSHADYDFWGPRREVILGYNPNDVIAAINERGITRLAVPDGGQPDEASETTVGMPEFEAKEVGALQDLVRSAFAYTPGGRTPGADVELAGLDPRTEQNPAKVLDVFRTLPPPRSRARARRPIKEFDPQFDAYQRSRANEITQQQLDFALERRRRISADGLATETYRRITVDEALRRLMPVGVRRTVNP